MEKQIMLWMTGFCILLAFRVFANPPDYFGISGYVLQSSGSQAPLGTIFRINNTNTLSVISSVLQSPVSGHTGWYSEMLVGSAGNIIEIYSWNSTHYGYEQVTLTGDMEKNMTLNLSRPPEINISIIIPQDDAEFSQNAPFVVNASIQVLGSGSAENCSLVISFDGSCIGLAGGETAQHNVNSISGTYFEAWDVNGTCPGLGNITVNSTCDTDSLYFEGIKQDTVYGINITNAGAPAVGIIFPKNNTQIRNTENVAFTYNVSDIFDISNCSLFINGAFNDSTPNPQQNLSLNFTVPLANRDYSWNIQCYNIYGTFGSSGEYNFSLAYFVPIVSDLTVTDPIDLLAGSGKVIFCNGTVNDGNGYGNIDAINATFYFSEGGYNSGDADDENSHYSSECNVFNKAGNSSDFSCNFSVLYHAPPGTWECNVSAFDIDSNMNDSKVNSTINQLYAMDLPLNMDYGNIDPGDISPDANIDIQNIGNVNISISVKGFGSLEGDNLSMICNSGNISVNNERFDKSSGINFNLMNMLTGGFAIIPEFEIPKQTDSPNYGSLYWKIFAQPGIRGACNGSIILSITT